MSEGSRPPTSKQHTLYLTCGTNLMSAYTLLQSCHCGQGPTPPVNSAASLIRCALASLQLSQVPVSSALIMAAKRPLRPDTLERICYLWNKGRCAFPGSYWFRHVCACRRKGHHARSVTKPPLTHLTRVQPQALHLPSRALTANFPSYLTSLHVVAHRQQQRRSKHDRHSLHVVAHRQQQRRSKHDRQCYYMSSH